MAMCDLASVRYCTDSPNLMIFNILYFANIKLLRYLIALDSMIL